VFINIEIDYDLIGYYFSFIDLTHRSDFLVDKVGLNGWALAIDYLTKLIVGFFIYQFIAALENMARIKNGPIYCVPYSRASAGLQDSRPHTGQSI